MRLRLHIFVLAFVLAATRTFAQAPAPLTPEPEAWTFTPFVGAGFGGDLESAPVTFGAALGYGLTPHCSVEGEFHFAPDASEGQVIEFDASIFGLSGSALYHFRPNDDFTPYLAAGLGFATANADLDKVGLVGDDTSTKFVWNWGGGMTTAFAERYGIRADLRYFHRRRAGFGSLASLWGD
jgi:opacity protein-like surface antigen